MFRLYSISVFIKFKMSRLERWNETEWAEQDSDYFS